MQPRHRFRFGVINEWIGSRQVWLDHVREVEDRGFQTFLIRDHVVPDYFGDQFAPLVALMAAAAATQQLRVGTLVLNNDVRHPVWLAKEAATLDQLSGGRFELGLGAGWLDTEYQQAGLRYDRPGVRIERLREAIQVIKGVWAADPYSLTGEHYQIQAINGVPKPDQPRLPLLLGAGHRRMLTLAGQEADIVGVMTTSVATGQVQDDPLARLAPAVAERVGWIREGAGARFGQIELSLVATLLVTDQRRVTTEQFIQQRGWRGISCEQVWEMPAVLIGSVDQICEDLQRWREQLGFSYLIVADADAPALTPVVARLAGQ